MGALKNNVNGANYGASMKGPQEAASGIEDGFIRDMSKFVVKANQIPEELYIKKDVKRGLRNADGTGVVVGLTHIGEVVGYERGANGEKLPVPGKLYYRGYNVEDLFNNCVKEDRFGFEEVTYLLIFGELPSKQQLNEFCAFLGRKRELPAYFARDMIMTVPSANIMNKLARSVLALYSYDDDAENLSVENVLRQSISLIGNFPTLIAYGYQAKKNFYDGDSLHLHYPVPELGTAENILRMIRSDGQYTDIEAKLLDLSLILHAEHGGGNNSAFTTHIVTSSGTDTYSAIAAAVCSLKGPRHGGANISVLNMIRDLKSRVADISDRKAVENYLRDVLDGKANDGSGLIYGLGHAIYTISDPRAILLKEMARKLADSKGLEEDFALFEFIENNGPLIYAEKTGKHVTMPANVDLYSGFVYSALNIPTDIATPLFALARLSGWCAHRLEELVGAGKLMRPAYHSIQPHAEYVPLCDRI